MENNNNAIQLSNYFKINKSTNTLENQNDSSNDFKNN